MKTKTRDGLVTVTVATVNASCAVALWLGVFASLVRTMA